MVLEDNSALLWAVLKATYGPWLYVVQWWDNFSILTRDDDDQVDDNWLLWHLMDQNALRLQNLGMLKHSLKIIQFGGCGTMRRQQGTQAHNAMAGLLIDYKELVERTEGQLVGVQHRLGTLAAIRSITESEKSIKQSEKIGFVISSPQFSSKHFYLRRLQIDACCWNRSLAIRPSTSLGIGFQNLGSQNLAAKQRSKGYISSLKPLEICVLRVREWKGKYISV